MTPQRRNLTIALAAIAAVVILAIALLTRGNTTPSPNSAGGVGNQRTTTTPTSGGAKNSGGFYNPRVLETTLQRSLDASARQQTQNSPGHFQKYTVEPVQCVAPTGDQTQCTATITETHTTTEPGVRSPPQSSSPAIAVSIRDAGRTYVATINGQSEIGHLP